MPACWLRQPLRLEIKVRVYSCLCGGNGSLLDRRVEFGVVLLDQRKLAQRSERVKSVDLHPTEPW